MRVWQKYLPEITALQLRAKQLEDTLNIEALHRSRFHLSPNQAFHKLDLAHDAKDLYIRAHRLCMLVLGVEDYGAPRSLSHLSKTMENGIRRMTDIIHLLDNKITEWGLKDKIPSDEDPMSELVSEDENVVEDNIDTDSLKAELRQSLRALSDIIEYMEKPTLLTIRKELNKLINY